MDLIITLTQILIVSVFVGLPVWIPIGVLIRHRYLEEKEKTQSGIYEKSEEIYDEVKWADSTAGFERLHIDK